MEGYGYPYGPGFQVVRPTDPQFLDHGDGYGEYVGMGPMTEDLGRRPSRSKHQLHKTRSRSRSRSRSKTWSRSRSRSHSRSRSRSRPRKNRSRSRTRSHSRSRSGSRQRETNFKEPGFLDAFRVLYLAPSKHRKNAAKFLATKKRQDRIQELLKNDGLGSKRWRFYPRLPSKYEPVLDPGVTESRETCDQRVKIDADFFRKYKRSSKVDNDAPIRKLKRWELIFYKKLGFIQAV